MIPLISGEGRKDSLVSGGVRNDSSYIWRRQEGLPLLYPEESGMIPLLSEEAGPSIVSAGGRKDSSYYL